MTPTVEYIEAPPAAVADYVDRCRPLLADLSAGQRTQLIEDIEQIVGEVAMELQGRPDDLVGPPERFVAELRSAAGLAPQPVAEPSPVGPDLGTSEVFRAIGDWIRGVAVPWLRRLAAELRPAGWVVRAVGLAAVVSVVTSERPQGWVPNAFGSNTLGVAMTSALIVASVNVGRARVHDPLRRIVVALVSLVGVVGAGIWADQARIPAWDPGEADHVAIAEVFVPPVTTVAIEVSPPEYGIVLASERFEPQRTESTTGALGILSDFRGLGIPPLAIQVYSPHGELLNFSDYAGIEEYVESLAAEGYLFDGD